MKIYKELLKYPYYFACDDGNIYSKRYGNSKDYGKDYRILKKSKSQSGKGYFQVSLSCDGKVKQESVHRLIAEAFIGEIPKGLTVSHLDGDKFNNIPSNLAIETYSKNLQRKHQHKTSDVGFRNSRAKINEQQYIEIKKLLKEGNLTHEKIGERFNVSRVFITKINTKCRYNFKE